MDDTKTPRDAVAAYVRGKDENRPMLAERAFAAAASLRIVARTDAIAFPASTHGRDAIVDVLVRQFGRQHENVRTLCLASPPDDACASFRCAWLVGMSQKDDRTVRVGCGHYTWSFPAHTAPLADALEITIDAMDVLASKHLVPVIEWLQALPYPWCAASVALERAPRLAALGPIVEWLHAVVRNHGDHG